MEILGQIGIDLNMILAQMINFTILIILLNTFLYRPIINKIQKDEEELEELEKTKSKIEYQSQKLYNQQEEIIETAKRKAISIVKEANEIASEIKEENTKNSIEKNKSQQSQLQAIVSPDWEKIGEKITKLISRPNVETLKESYFKEVTVQIEQLAPHITKSRNVILEYANFSTNNELEKITQIIQNFKAEIDIKKIKNQSLIVGYRLNIDGIEISQNLLSELINESKE